MLRKVCLQLGRERDCSRARPSPRATSSRRPASSVLLRKVPTVRHALRILDPEGVSERLRHRLQRRQYKGRGPNFLWHFDGFDKLKPIDMKEFPFVHISD